VHGTCRQAARTAQAVLDGAATGRGTESPNESSSLLDAVAQGRSLIEQDGLSPAAPQFLGSAAVREQPARTPPATPTPIERLIRSASRCKPEESNDQCDQQDDVHGRPAGSARSQHAVDGEMSPDCKIDSSFELRRLPRTAASTGARPRSARLGGTIRPTDTVDQRGSAVFFADALADFLQAASHSFAGVPRCQVNV
jgi:hypothetical protein